MEKSELYQMTNGYGKKFIDTWLKDQEILGIEKRPSNLLRKEFTIIYRYDNGEIYTAVLPDSASADNGCCFFGNLKHFSMCYAEDCSGIVCRLGNGGNLIWPTLTCNDHEKISVFVDSYHSMMQKYEQFPAA